MSEGEFKKKVLKTADDYVNMPLDKFNMLVDEAELERFMLCWIMQIKYLILVE